MAWWWYSDRSRDKPCKRKPPAWLRSLIYRNEAEREFKRRDPVVKRMAQVYREDKSLKWSLNNPIARREWPW